MVLGLEYINQFDTKSYCQNILSKKEEIYKKEHELLGLSEYYYSKELKKFKTILFFIGLLLSTS